MTESSDKPITKAMLEQALVDIHEEAARPHVHVVNPNGGRCECGLYISKGMLR